MSWDPELYNRFEDDRLRPALELLARVPPPAEEPRRIADLGCGTGGITALLAERWPEASVVGLDSSAEMLERARAEVGDAARFELGDIAAFAEESSDEPYDVLYSNAALHWLPNHAELFPRLLGRLRPGGVLAVQMPLSWDQPYAREMRALLDEHDLGSAELRERLGRRPVERSAWYWRLLHDDVATIDLWETEYQHQLRGDDPIVEWTRATALRPVLDELSDADGDTFLQLYREAVGPLYREREGTTLFPFRRLFMVCSTGV